LAAVRTARLQADAEAAFSQVEATVRIALSWAAMAETSVRFQAAMISQDAAVDNAFKGAIDETDSKLEAQRNLLEAMALSPRERELFEKINDKHTALMAVAIGIRSQRELGNSAEARTQADALFRPAAAQYLLTLSEFVTAQEKLAVAAREHYAEQRKTTIRVAQGVLVLIVLGIFLGTALLVRSIRIPLADAVGVARRVAAGELEPVAASDRRRVRRPDARAGRDGRPALRDGGAHQGLERPGGQRGARDRAQPLGPVQPHRGAGLGAGGDLGLDAANERDGGAERAEREAGQPGGGASFRGRRQGR